MDANAELSQILIENGGQPSQEASPSQDEEDATTAAKPTPKNSADLPGIRRAASAANRIDSSGHDVDEGKHEDGGTVLDELEVNVNFKSESFTSIFGPVILTMTLAAIAVVNINSETTEQLGEGLRYYVPSGLRPSSGDSAGADFLKSAGFALIVIGFITCATFIVVLCIKYNCIRALVSYMLFSTTMLLGFMGGTAVYATLEMFEVPADWPSFVFIMYNFAVVGIVSVFWQKGMDHFWTNGYLIAVSVILAFELAQFNTVGEWIPWCLLGALALYDLCAVLTPCGPLRLLINAVTENEGGEQALNGLLFEADVGQHQGAEEIAQSQRLHSRIGQARNTQTLVQTHNTVSAGETKSDLEHGDALLSSVNDKKDAHDDGNNKLLNRENMQATVANSVAPAPASAENDVRGVKLGLGDFIFYSVLVSTAARHDFVTFASCTLVVLLGLGLTLLLLIVAGKALPALPISIFLGVFFYFLGRYTLEPYVDTLTFHGIVI